MSRSKYFQALNHYDISLGSKRIQLLPLYHLKSFRILLKVLILQIIEYIRFFDSNYEARIPLRLNILCFLENKYTCFNVTVV